MGTFTLLLYGILLGALSLPEAAAHDILGGFRNPAAEYKPKFRYWLLDASTDADIVRQDIRDIASVGAGGFELLPYYQFGRAPTNWSEYGHGGGPENDLLMDFAVGANQGQGVPAPPESLGLAVHLAYANVSLASGATFNGTIPLSRQPIDPALSFMHSLEEFGTQKLSDVVAVEILSGSISQEKEVGQIIDLTPLVNSESRWLSWTAPNGLAGRSWRIMAWYERYTNQRSINPGPNAINFLQNGSWIVDHFSAEGAQIMTKFFDDHVVPGEKDRELLRAVGNYAWEDSMEMNSVIWWTPGFAARFRRDRGYSIRQCLPLLMNKRNGWSQSTVAYGEAFKSNNASLSVMCNEDYRLILQDGYEEYVKFYVNWARQRGIAYSNQPAYNLPLNLLKSVALLDAPEVESWGFSDNIDYYRYFSSPAHVTGNPVVSSECDAVSNGAYTQTIGDLLRSVHRGMAGGISMNVFHGFPYSGRFANTTWPGVTIFSYMFTEMWGPRQPVWKHMADMMSYVARNQFISQTGTPKVDLAVYSHAAPWTVDQAYGSDNLRNNGFTYDYLDPTSLEDGANLFDDHVLFPKGPRYKALIFVDGVAISPEAAAQVEHLAAQGLPMIFVGETNPRSIGRDTEGSARVSLSFVNILSQNFANVVHIDSIDRVVETLRESLHINPDVTFKKDGSSRDWYALWRSTPEAELVWLYNDNNTEPGSTIRFANVGGHTPYRLDAWSGDASAVIQYDEDGNDLVIPVSLHTNQTFIFAFRKPSAGCRRRDSLFGPKLREHVTSVTGSTVEFTYKHDTRSAQVDARFTNGPVSIELSDGEVRQLEGTPLSATNLSRWDLKIESWHQTEDLWSTQTAITRFELEDIALATWNQLGAPGLVNASGVGIYTANFSTPQTTTEITARLHLGYIQDSVQVWLNGKALPALDHRGQDKVVDLTNFLARASDGTPTVNFLKVEVRTTLLNRIKAEKGSLVSMGSSANHPQAAGPLTLYNRTPNRDYGLVGPVWIEWLNNVRIL